VAVFGLVKEPLMNKGTHHDHHRHYYCHFQLVINGISNTLCPFISFLCRCLQKFPVAFLKCDVAIPMIHCAVVASTLEHRDANLSVMKFLKCLVSCVTEKV